ncbi:hypothetical protein EIN_492550 [Entamoeba invadens IP1]|uniref:Protein SDA1 n=1 Tax=Entamoeba invadens IP1 TaxID=370355 RepID=A0A0A1U7H6_ENTIV|nr:hypothetical protein EIN_492550 [Entamoeba invadens IP1]ELP88996.1 hypothetical protein EIN_492550 [Entamoeba invadens IP1]|eukprot:XP_004255767.1 hypothetical protein EIN_492550 [Entamoeba invadens IP1]
MSDYTIIQKQMKEDPQAYVDDLKQYYEHFKSSFTTMVAQSDLGVTPAGTTLDEMLRLVVFLNNVSAEYKTELAEFPVELVEILKKCKLPSNAKVTITKALIGLRSKGFLSLDKVLPVLLEMLCTKDKNVKGITYRFIINDIKNSTNKKGGAKSKAETMRLFEQIIDSNANSKIVKKIVEILSELFVKNVMKTQRVVNIIANAIFHLDAKVKVKALEFFLRLDEKQEELDDDTKKDIKVAEKDLRVLTKKLGIKKKTGKLRTMKKDAEENLKKLRKTEILEHQPNWGAIDALYDGNAFCDKLYRDIKGSRNRFEIRLLELDLMSRIIARKEVVCLPFYTFIVRYLYPRHEHITKLLAFTAQSIHSLIPPDVVEPIVRTILNNFVSDRSRVEAQSLGLNTIRVICERCPLVMNKGMLADLADYKKSHNKAVVSASRSIIELFKTLDPELLRKKDRGKPGKITPKGIMQFGEEKVYEGPVGAELLENDENGEEEESSENSEGSNSKEMDEENNEANDGQDNGSESGENAMSEDDVPNLSDEFEECSDDSDEEFEEVSNDDNESGESESEDNEAETKEMEEESPEEKVGSYVGGIITQEQLEAIRRKQAEEEGIDSSEEYEERDRTFVSPDSIAPDIKKKMTKAERIKVLKDSKAENDKFKRVRGKTSKVLARNKPFFMKSFGKKDMKKEEERITSGKTTRRPKQFAGKMRKRFGKNANKQKSFK